MSGSLALSQIAESQKLSRRPLGLNDGASMGLSAIHHPQLSNITAHTYHGPPQTGLVISTPQSGQETA